ncbi:SDR family oxidoreductase [Candidatus Dojkabacteria bacterium]|nr:SDR family oxidoreductase [Candidatus Dojkabacteria bacterium]
MKTVLITGASSGFGALMAVKFARGGYYVYATARDLSKEGVKEVSKISESENLQIEWLKLDVTKDEDIASALKRVRENGKGLDVLVNNAGYGLIGPVETFTLDQIKSQFDTNYFGAIRMIHAFLPMMREQRRGNIINISSVAGFVTSPMYGIYSSSKHAIEALTEALRGEVRQFGINASLIEPGSYDTKFGTNIKGRDVDSNSPYYDFVTKLVKGRENLGKGFLYRMMSRLKDPKFVVDRVYRVAQMKNPPLRNIVGIDAKFEYFGRRVISSSAWDWVMKVIVGMLTKK